MKASELRSKDAAGLSKELSELLKAQASLRMQRPPNSCRTPAS
jgi:large subunit ribosomal protein L29